MKSRLKKQIQFILEIDKLKTVLRQTLLTNGLRHENDAEHSWHLAVMAILLSEYASAPRLNINHVISMLLVHDLVEIDAGDTYIYDEAGQNDKAEREQRAADRIFALLPADQCHAMRQLWNEFEARETPEAKFCAALDRLQPLLHNIATHGAIWKKHGITSDRVFKRNQHMAEGAPELWDYAKQILHDAIDRGDLAP